LGVGVEIRKLLKFPKPPLAMRPPPALPHRFARRALIATDVCHA